MPTAASIKTLIVDDQQTMRSLIRTSLQALGINQTREAPDGEEALRQLLAAPANLVITDFNMPKMNGVELARRLHALRPDLPILVMSGYTAPVDPSQASARCSRSRSRRTRSRRRSASRSSGRPRILPGVDSSRPGEAGTCREHE